MIAELTIHTKTRTEFIDITRDVQSLINNEGFDKGFVFLFNSHTTAGLTINEGADPAVRSDILNALLKLVPHHGGYSHLEGNADAHIKATLTGSSLWIAVENGSLVLGRWQSVFFCEYDGPRTRRVFVKFLSE